MICHGCGQDKTPNQFTRCGNGRKRRVCRTCEGHAKRTRRYGISPEEYVARYIAQGGCCAICGKHYAVLHVDHEHMDSERERADLWPV